MAGVTRRACDISTREEPVELPSAAAADHAHGIDPPARQTCARGQKKVGPPYAETHWRSRVAASLGAAPKKRWVPPYGETPGRPGVLASGGPVRKRGGSTRRA